jgi:hypothetical protein
MGQGAFLLLLWKRKIGGKMRIPKLTALSVAVLMTTAYCSAQQKWPLRPGEWVMTSSDSGSTTFLYCLNDEMWQKALTQNPVCTIQSLSISPMGASYFMNCPMKSFQMKGPVTLTFDGMQHMTGKAVLEMTVNGKTTTATSLADYHWKSATCSPDDMNMHTRKTQ